MGGGGPAAASLPGTRLRLVPYKQWMVFLANFGQGPFRWAVFDHQGGNLLGYSASFNLPGAGLTQFMSLSR